MVKLTIYYWRNHPGQSTRNCSLTWSNTTARSNTQLALGPAPFVLGAIQFLTHSISKSPTTQVGPFL